MAIYNPDNINPYYDPDLNPGQDQIESYNTDLEQYPKDIAQKEAGMGSIFGSIAKGMLVYGIGTTLLKNTASKLLVSSIKQFAKPTGTISKITSKLLGEVPELSKITTPLQKFSQKVLDKSPMEIPTARILADEIPIINRTLEKYSKIAQPYRKALTDYELKSANIRANLERKSQFSELKFTQEKLKTYWSKDDRLKRVVGTAERYASKYMENLPAFYAVDRITRIGKEGTPSLFDIPGNIKDFAKFNLSMFPVDLGMKGIGQAFKFSKLAGTAGLKKIVAPVKEPLNRFFDRLASSKAYNQLGNVKQHIYAFSKTVENINDDIGRRFRSHTIGKKADRELLKKKTSFFDTDELKNLVKTSKEIYSRELSSIRSKKANDFIRVNLYILLYFFFNSIIFIIIKKAHQLI